MATTKTNKIPPFLQFIIGFTCIIFAGIVTVVIHCPTKGQYFVIYLFTTVGIALVFQESVRRSKLTYKELNFKFVLFGAPVLFAGLLYINPISNFKDDDCDLRLRSISQTVNVYNGKKGRHEKILSQQGSVIMDVKSEKKRATINELGQAHFENVYIGEKVRLSIEFSEPYISMYPDSIYVLEANTPIYLPVTLKGLSQISGIVLFGNSPLEGVNISVDTLSTLTRKDGRFYLSIPEGLQRKEQYVWVAKKGFKSKKVVAYPQTETPVEIIMEK